MAKKEVKTEKIEREYVIPLREKCRPVPRYKKTPKAVKTVKEFIAKHMKVENRDLKKVKIDSYLNEQLWVRGIKKTLHKVKVKVVKEGDIVRVYAVDLLAKIDFKKKRLDKREKDAEDAAKEVKESKKTLAEKAKEHLKGKNEDKDKNKDGVEDKAEEKEKEESVEEENQREMKSDSKEFKKAPKKGKEKLAEKKAQDQTSKGK